jgi:hypothetical protein
VKGAETFCGSVQATNTQKVLRESKEPKASGLLYSPMAKVELMACLATIALSFTKAEGATCQVPEPARPAKFVVNVPANADIAKVVNGDSATRATVFQLAANATYRVNALIVLKAGDELRGLSVRRLRFLVALPPTPTQPRSS